MLGAGIGAPLRYVIDRFSRARSDFPWGILFVNVVGSFILGVITGQGSNDLYFIGIGFCGAFTTWSAFILDLDRDRKEGSKTLLNVGLSLTLGILAAWCGLQLA